MDGIRETLTDVNGPRAELRGISAEIVVDDVTSAKSWSRTEIDLLLQDLERAGCGTDPMCVRFVFLNGHGQDLGDPHGITIGNAAIIFPDNLDYFLVSIENRGIPHPGLPQGERQIVIHELGHLLGLVNLSIPMQEPRLLSPDVDPCQCHSSHKGSVMYEYPADSLNTTLDHFLGTQFAHDEFDEADWNDIRDFQRALKNRAIPTT